MISVQGRSPLGLEAQRGVSRAPAGLWWPQLEQSMWEHTDARRRNPNALAGPGLCASAPRFGAARPPASPQLTPQRVAGAPGWGCHRRGPGAVEQAMAQTAHTRSATGAPLVLLHALGLSRRSWDPVMPALTAHFDVVAAS
jgi:hypothetical protein